MNNKAPLILPALLGAMLPALAQTVPNAGTLLQQIEKDRQPALPGRSTQDVQPPPPPLESLSGPSVTVAHFRFEGNGLLDDAALQPVVAPFLGRPLGFQELQRAALAVSAAYRKAGWIARAYLPRQEIEGGVVTIRVVEARFGGTRLSGPAPTRVDADRIDRFVQAAQPVGAPLNADALDRAILLIDDLPGVSASGNLAAGDRDNETVAVLKLEDEPAVDGTLSVDDTGQRSTGEWRETADLSLNSPLRLGDAATLDAIHARGTNYGRLGYSLPAGGGGWRVGVDASVLEYRLITADFAALHARGTSETLGLNANYALVRSRYRNLFLSLDYDHKRFDNRANGATTSRYRIDLASASVNGNAFDDWGGGGSTSGSLSIASGWLDLGGSPSEAADAASTRSAGAFNTLRYALNRQQALTGTLALYAAVSGQVASKNLDSSEKFYLGGATGVRAYPTSEAGGSNGQLASLELRARLPANFSATGFLDWGHVTVNAHNDFAGGAVLNTYSLKGAGVAAGWIAPHGLSLKATYAHRIGSNPNPTPSGADQDGTLKKNRFWLTATLTF